MKFVARAALAVLLLLGVYVLAAAVVGGLGFAIYQAFGHGLGGFLLGKGIVLVLFVALALGRALWAVRRLRDEGPSGLLPPEEEQPVLWEEVRALAATVGTRAPDEIRLVPEVNASVWEGSRLLGLVPGRRVMTLGVPLLLGMTRQQVRSVLAHELGHYSHRHTALSPVVYRGHVTLAHIVGRLGHDSLVGRVFAAYGRLYLRVTRSVTRQQELEADGWSHRVAGRAAAAGAMRELPALDGIWEHFLREYAFAVEGARPDHLFAGFRDLLASPQRQQEMAMVRQDLPEEPQNPYDTHPSGPSRVAFFESLPEDGVTDDGVPSSTLLVEPDRTLRRLEEQLFAESELEPRPWEWIAAAAGARRARHGAAMLVRATREPGSGASSLRDAVTALAQGRSRSLLRPYVDLDTPPERVEAGARELVADMVATALVEHCDARFAPDWDRGFALVDAAGQPVDVDGLVAGAVEDRSGDWLVRALESEGVPATYSIDLGQLDAEDAEDREPVVQSVAACIKWRRVRILVVAENALIVKRIGFGESLAAAARHGGTDVYVNAVRQVVSTPLPQLLADRRATVYEWDRVGAARLSGKRLALALDGKSHRFRVRPRDVAGDLTESLRHHLGDRLAVA